MEGIYKQDWHIHCTASYDGFIDVEEIIRRAKEYGITQFGISDHVNYPYMIEDLAKAKKLFDEHRVEGFHLGLELTTMSKYEIEYSRTPEFQERMKDPYCSRFFFLSGYQRPVENATDPVDFPLTEEEIRKYQVEYVIGAPHFIFDNRTDRKGMIESYQGQQMFCATDSRIDIVGHPWWCPYFPNNQHLYDNYHMITGEPWFDDFGVIPQSFHDEFAAALIENNKCAELNMSFYYSPLYTESFKHQYTQYIRSLFEKGVPITIGSDSHGDYGGKMGRYWYFQDHCERYLRAAGFCAEDFSAPKFRTYP